MTEQRPDEDDEVWIPWRKPLNPIPGHECFPKGMPIKRLSYGEGPSGNNSALEEKQPHESAHFPTTAAEPETAPVETAAVAEPRNTHERAVSEAWCVHPPMASVHSPPMELDVTMMVPLTVDSRIDTRIRYYTVVYYTTGGIFKIVTTGHQALEMPQPKHVYPPDGPTVQV